MTMRRVWCGVAMGGVVAILLACWLDALVPVVDIPNGAERTAPESGSADAVQIVERLPTAGSQRSRLPSRDEGEVPAAGVSSPEHAAATTDPEWGAMRRANFAFAQHVATTGHALRLNKIFRHRELNPRDVYIPPDKRQELADILRPLQEAMGDTLDARHAITAKEMAELVDRGEATLFASSNLNEAMASLRARGQFHVLHQDGGRIYGANSHDLPGSSSAESAMHVQGVEIGGAVVSWFYRQGCLEQREALRLLEALSGALSWNGK